jgi:membrane-associated phospholipid phosphatase
LCQPDYELEYARKWVSVSKEYALLAAAARHVLAQQSTSAAAEPIGQPGGRNFPASHAAMVVVGMMVVYVNSITEMLVTAS